MEVFSVESGIVTRIDDFFPYIRHIIQNLIDGNLQDLANEGYMLLGNLQTLVDKEREFYHSDFGQIEEQTPSGLYWLTIPPDHAIEDALAEAHCSNFDRESTFFIERCLPLMSSDDEYDFSLRNILDNQTPLPTSLWKIELPMWSNERETQLTLRLKMRIRSGNPAFSITDLEIM